jgi:hypothetical protein
MRYPTHMQNIQTALSPSVELTNKVLDLSGNAFSVSNISYNYLSTRQLDIIVAGSCQVNSAIRVSEYPSTEMKKTGELFSYSSAIIQDILPFRDQDGSTLKIYNNKIEFTNPSINIPGSSLITTNNKVSGTINTEALITTVETTILSMVAGTSPNWICTVDSIAGLLVDMDIQISGVSTDILISPFNTDIYITAKITAIISPNIVWISYSGSGSVNPPGPPTPIVTATSKITQSTVAITNAYIQLDGLRITIAGGLATPDLSGANPPALASSGDDSVYFSFISRYTNNISYSNTLYDIIVGHALPNGTVDWIHRVNGLVTTKEEYTPVLVCGSDVNELYIAYMTTGSTQGSLNGIEIFNGTSNYGICGCPSPETCTDCGLEDIVLARINTLGASSTTPPSVMWKVQNGYINSIYRETKPSMALDTVNKLVYLAYECNKNLACFHTTGSPNILLHCFTMQGNHLWVQAESQINSSGSNMSPSVAADNQGNVYLAYEITAQVSGGAAVPVGEKQIEVVRFQTILSTPSSSNTYDPTITYTYGTWVYYPSTMSWYQVRALSITNDPPGSSNWSEPYSANVFTSGRVWVLSETINIFTRNGILGDDSSKPSIVADPLNGNVFLSFLTTGNVVDDPSESLHDVVFVVFSKDRQIKWIKQGGDMFNPKEITYVECDSPYLIMDLYGNLTLSLLTYVRRVIGPPIEEGGEPVTELVMNTAIFNFTQTGDTRWNYALTETESYPVYMFARTDAPNAVFGDSPINSFTKMGIGRSYKNIYMGTITDLVASDQTQVGTPGVTKMLLISIFKEDVYYIDRNAFTYMTISRSICACGKENCGCI